MANIDSNLQVPFGNRQGLKVKCATSTMKPSMATLVIISSNPSFASTPIFPVYLLHHCHPFPLSQEYLKHRANRIFLMSLLEFLLQGY